MSKQMFLMLSIFSQTLYTPNKITGTGDMDPPWMNDLIKNKIKEKNKTFKLYKNNRMGGNFSNLQKLSKELSELITKRKEDYNSHLANKLNDPQSSPKTFRKIFKIFYNGNKISLIPSIIVNNKLVSDYEEKANHFNKFFAAQCSPIDNDSHNAHPLTMILIFNLVYCMLCFCSQMYIIIEKN